MMHFNDNAAQGRKAAGRDIGCSDLRLGFTEAGTGIKIMMAGTLEPPKGGNGTGTDLMVRPKTRTQKPKMYKVIIMNDDFTPMDFVVDLLKRVFGKNHGEAFDIMMQVHKLGAGLAGVYSYEIAETKKIQAESDAFKEEHPLKLTLEPV